LAARPNKGQADRHGAFSVNIFHAANLRKILLIQLGDIGDVVLALPCACALREHFADARVMMAVREKAAQLIEAHPCIDGVFGVDTTPRNVKTELLYQTAFFSKLRRERFDMAVELRTGQRGAILAFLSGAGIRAAFHAKDGGLWRNRVFTHLVTPYATPGTHVIEQNLSLLTALGIQTAPAPRPALTVSTARKRAADDLLRAAGVPAGKPLVAVQPFSLWRYKEWGLDKTVRLIDHLTGSRDLSVVITGSADERDRGDDILRRCRGDVYNLAGRTEIGVYAALLSICRLFVGMDSAGLHIAAAVGTPTLGIFGPTSANDWAPREGRHQVVYETMPCVPCRRKGCMGSGISRCLEKLSVRDIAQKAGDLLNRGASFKPSPNGG